MVCYARLFFCDFSKDFDLVNQNLLLNELIRNVDLC